MTALLEGEQTPLVGIGHSQARKWRVARRPLFRALIPSHLKWPALPRDKRVSSV